MGIPLLYNSYKYIATDFLISSQCLNLGIDYLKSYKAAKELGMIDIAPSSQAPSLGGFVHRPRKVLRWMLCVRRCKQTTLSPSGSLECARRHKGRYKQLEFKHMLSASGALAKKTQENIMKSLVVKSVPEGKLVTSN